MDILVEFLFLFLPVQENTTACNILTILLFFVFLNTYKKNAMLLYFSILISY